MGLSGAVSHTLIKVALNSIILWVILVLFMDISMDKMPMLLLVALVANVLSSLIASLLLMKRRGY